LLLRVVTGGSDNGTDNYTYDIENRLIGLVKGTSGGAGTYAYSYDYRTRRIVRDETSASGTITNLVYSGGTSVQEYDGTTPALAVEYLRGSDYGGGVGGILYTVRSGERVVGAGELSAGSAVDGGQAVACGVIGIGVGLALGCFGKPEILTLNLLML